MTEITTMQEFEALNEESAANTVGMKLFNLRAVDNNYEGKKIYSLQLYIDNNRLTKFTEDFPKWLHSPEGIHAIKQAMGARGYSYVVEFDAEKPKCEAHFFKGYTYDFLLDLISSESAEESTEEEAVINAAAKALLSNKV